MLDVVLPRLSRAANHSVLWMGVAALLAATGGRFGRRAAVRGLGVLGVTSATVNLPAKLLARRTRPVIDIVPEVRRLARLPTSTSFPSGHAASAAAFATGAALERGRLAVPLGTLAAGVALSRVHTGVHYPGDVLAGAAVGAGIAWGSRRLWPVTPPADKQQVSPPVRMDRAPLQGGDGLVLVANPNAGYAWSGDPVGVLRRRLPRAEIREPAESDDLPTVLAAAAADGRALGVAGGDGTVSAAAAAAHEARIPLVVIPAGTLNHLARDLGIETVDDAVRAVEIGERLAMDLGTVDGRVFCNVVCVGVYPELVQTRERLQPRVGEWLAMVGSLVQTMRGARPVRMEIDGRSCSVWMVFVGNCRYDDAGLAPAWRRRLHDGLLDVRIVSAEEPWTRARLLFASATGTLERSRVYRRQLQREVRIRCIDGPQRVSADGEVLDGIDTLTIGKTAEPLIVYAPHR